MSQTTALSPQEIKRKLSNPATPAFNTAAFVNSTSQEKPASSTTTPSKHKRAPSHSPATTDTEDESGPNASLAPPPQANAQPTSPRAPLAAISEAEDAGADDFSDDEEDQEEEELERRGMADLANAHHIKSGYLLKRGERRKAWKKRHFVLRMSNLAYYKNDKEYKLLRIIPLEEVHSCASCEAKKQEFIFAIVTTGRTYVVKTKSKDDMDDWVSKINAAIRSTDDGSKAGAAGANSPLEGSVTLTSPTPTRGPATELQSTSRSIAIPGTTAPTTSTTTAPPSQAATPSAQSNVTTSPSTPFSPNILLSSSHTSQQSQLTSEATSPVGSPPSVPPNSLATTGPLGLQAEAGRDNVSNLDAGLQRLSLADRSPRDRRGSLSGGTSSGGEGPSPPRHHASKGRSEDARAASPNVASSSEDEDYDAPDSPIARTGSNLPVPGGADLARTLDPNRIIMQGYLMKQGKRKNWRKRWFQLVSEKLVYSRSHVDAKVHRQIPISKILDAIEYAPPPTNPKSGPMAKDASASSTSAAELEVSSPSNNVVVGGLSGNKKYENCFKIITMKRTYLVCAPTEEEEVNWLSALQLLIASRRKQAQPQQAQSQGHAGGQGQAAVPSLLPASPARPIRPGSAMSQASGTTVTNQSAAAASPNQGATPTPGGGGAATVSNSQPLQKHASSGTLNLPSIESQLLTRTASNATTTTTTPRAERGTEQALDQGAVRG